MQSRTCTHKLIYVHPLTHSLSHTHTHTPPAFIAKSSGFQQTQLKPTIITALDRAHAQAKAKLEANRKAYFKQVRATRIRTEQEVCDIVGSVCVCMCVRIGEIDGCNACVRARKCLYVGLCFGATQDTEIERDALSTVMQVPTQTIGVERLIIDW
jgi:hypothetical protein